MTPEDQDDFAPKPCRYRDADSGALSESTTIGGAPLLGSQVKGPAETFELREAVMQCIGLSRSVLDRVKKKVAAELVGQGSSRKLSSDGDSNPPKSAS